MSQMKISEVIEKLTQIKNQKGDLPIGADNGYCISFLESMSINTYYDHEDLDENGNCKEIDFVEFNFEF